MYEGVRVRCFWSGHTFVHCIILYTLRSSAAALGKFVSLGISMDCRNLSAMLLSSAEPTLMSWWSDRFV